jgi:hypothetical protein
MFCLCCFPLNLGFRRYPTYYIVTCSYNMRTYVTNSTFPIRQVYTLAIECSTFNPRGIPAKVQSAKHFQDHSSCFALVRVIESNPCPCSSVVRDTDESRVLTLISIRDYTPPHTRLILLVLRKLRDRYHARYVRLALVLREEGAGGLIAHALKSGLEGLLLEDGETERARLGDTVGYREVHADMHVYTETTSSRSAAASPT